jgi:hypothetical protein
MAKQFYQTFLSSTHGSDGHENPKTMAIVDTAAFVMFQSAWEALCAEMTRLLEAGDDADFVANLKRARTQTIGFSGVLDSDPNVRVLSGMDIGSFLAMFESSCNPVASSQLRTLLDAASTAYSAMFVERGVGPGTPEGTGMHITWVAEEEYDMRTSLYHPFQFDQTTDELPNYLNFLATFYNTSTPAAQTSASPVCGNTVEPTRSAVLLTELLIDPGFYSADGSNVEIRSQVTRSVDFVLVEYGIDATHFLSEDARRRLHQSLRANEARRKLRDAETGHDNQHRRRWYRSMSKNHDRTNDRYRHHQRRAQDAGDLFLIYGGDVAYVYDGANVTATWDRVFYWLKSGNNTEPAYVVDEGNGAKSIPVCYFGPQTPITPEDIPIGTAVDDMVKSKGCLEGFVTFSVTNFEGVSLYVYRPTGGATDGGNATTLAEMPASAGGQVVPIVFILYSFAGEEYAELLGGFNTTIIPWGVDTDLTIFPIDDVTTQAVYESDAVFMNMFAYDFDANIADNFYFPYSVNGSSTGTGGTPPVVTTPIDDPVPPPAVTQRCRRRRRLVGRGLAV